MDDSLFSKSAIDNEVTVTLLYYNVINEFVVTLEKSTEKKESSVSLTEEVKALVDNQKVYGG